MKICRSCGNTKELNEFRLSKKHLSGRTSSCKKCLNAKARNSYALCPERRAHNKVSNIRAQRLRLYGLSEQEYHELLSRQNGVCAVCGNQDKKALSVDHDHKTNVVRGLVCQRCNFAIGLLKDDTRRIKNLLLYLEEPEVSALDDRRRGLYRKYFVEKTDGSSEYGQKHANCEYFVLDLDHDPYAREAAKAYAEACRGTHPLLADDLSGILKFHDVYGGLGYGKA